ncbi:MAG: hypothetical protein HKL90_10500 [Elusimicrobia bacterium]|nr:hypothetical protein [Elusimicrobiota bacterium]
MTGNVYWVKTGNVLLGNYKNSYNEIELGQGFTSKEEYEKADLKKIVDGLIQNHEGTALPDEPDEPCG